MMSNVVNLLKDQIIGALKPSVKSAIWLLRMMLPIMLVVSVLDFYGVIGYVSQFTTPLFNLIGLDGQAAFVYITSCLASIYSAIGVMALFGFDLREVTIMASMCLIAHNLIIEGAIQSRTGVSFWGITTLRIVSSLICGYLLNLIIPVELSGKLYLDVVTVKAESFGQMLGIWATTSLRLIVKVIVIIYLLNVLQNILRAFNLIDKLTQLLYPIIALLGLPRSTSFLWILANTLGLAYGGAVIVEEVSKGYIAKKEAALLNISIAQTHSLVEDTILFVTLGVGALWLMVPRLIFSIVTVWGWRLFQRIKGNFRFSLKHASTSV
ncbi:MAG: nucleoside recognition domain-containing protein [Rikenellaceae bacterium]